MQNQRLEIPSPRHLVLAGVLLLLAVRMTITETLRLSLGRMMAAIQFREALVTDPGPDTILVFFLLSLALAGATAWIGPVTRRAWVLLGVTAALLAALAAATWDAENRFLSLIGSADIATGLLAGWSVCVLATDTRSKRFIAAVLVGMLAAYAARGLIQYYVEFPDDIAAFQRDPAKVLASLGLAPDSLQATAFRYRLLSRELTAFFSLSNVTATALIALCTAAAGVLLAALFCRRPAAAAAPRRDGARAEIPLLPLLLVVLALLLAGAVLALTLTSSKGGTAMTVLCMVALLAGIAGRKSVSQNRYGILAVAACLGLCLAATLFWYGATRDALPSKSLLFRWHYWTASATLIADNPLTGVGVNNFGDYYLAVKRPSSPEDVKDPHAFFIRFLAEAGIPAAALVAALIVLYVLAAVRRQATTPEEAHPPDRVALTGGVVFCAAWWTIRGVLAATTTYEALQCLVYAVLAAGAMLATLWVLEHVTRAGLRAVLAALLLGALGMLVYDQINMALVTGPVAMLFWVLLGAAAADDGQADGSRRGRVAALTLWAGGLLLLALVVVPVWTEKFAWDPRPFERRFVKDAMSGRNFEALQDLDAAIQRAPQALDLRRYRIQIRQRVGKPVATEIRRVLDLDRANAEVRVALAMEPSDLPPAERVLYLEQALELDAQLPPKEAKLLSPEKRRAVQDRIAELRALIRKKART